MILGLQCKLAVYFLWFDFLLDYNTDIGYPVEKNRVGILKSLNKMKTVAVGNKSSKYIFCTLQDKARRRTQNGLVFICNDEQFITVTFGHRFLK